MRLSLLLCLVALSCDSLWSPYSNGNPEHCVINPALCTAGLVCNTLTGDCIAPETKSNPYQVPTCATADLIAALMLPNTTGLVVSLKAGCVYTFTAPGYYLFGPSALPPQAGSHITIEGNGAILERDPSAPPFRLQAVLTGSLAKPSSAPANLILRNLTLRNFVAQGGQGGSGGGGGGGGAGLGGALFVQGWVELYGVTVVGNTARGGNGGAEIGNTGSGSLGSGGGGGMSGSGGDGTKLTGGGGGGFRYPGDTQGNGGSEFLPSASSAHDGGLAGLPSTTPPAGQGGRGSGGAPGIGGSGALGGAAGGSSGFGGTGGSVTGQGGAGGDGGGGGAGDTAGGGGGGGAGFSNGNGGDGTANLTQPTVAGGGGGALGSGGGGGVSNFSGAFTGGGGGGVGGGGGGSGFSTSSAGVVGGGGGGFGGGGGGGGFSRGQAQSNTSGGGFGGFGGGGGGALLGQAGFGGGSAQVGGGGGLGAGGAIFVFQGTVIASNCTFTQNLAQAGGGGAASGSGTRGSALGGSIFNLNGTVKLYNVTISHNRLALPAQGSRGMGANVSVGVGGAVYNLSLGSSGTPVAKSVFYNSILSDSTLTDGTAAAMATMVSDVVNEQRVGSAVVDATGANLIGIVTGTIKTGSLLTEVDPQLGDLADNGGLTATRLPAASSPVVGLGEPLTCYSSPVNAVDQRGTRRPPACTLGAVEVGAAPRTATGCGMGGPAPAPWHLVNLILWLVTGIASLLTRRRPHCVPAVNQKRKIE